MGGIWWELMGNTAGYTVGDGQIGMFLYFRKFAKKMDHFSGRFAHYFRKFEAQEYLELLTLCKTNLDKIKDKPSGNHRITNIARVSSNSDQPHHQ